MDKCNIHFEDVDWLIVVTILEMWCVHACPWNKELVHLVLGLETTMPCSPVTITGQEELKVEQSIYFLFDQTSEH